ncbi:hypothetical protein I3843_09G219300 [Carya illinoinensis]|uniref:Uncharacterized protein n=1 Tax=Carya illinoinensis TaxID=32201 RepID=A0A922E6W8_CARIL|nr:hypothetical protein I3760_09G224300 [Carya illinoinensis]KAG6697951.1 hypothetical protein I3842_09G227100 [Carya illinoinensis]KAG7965360.1 hypothetical protein I3843_09G219300 [Carya illinoinensis]
MGSAQYYMHKGAPFMTGRSISATACGIWQRNGGTRSSLRSSLLLLIINNKKEKIRISRGLLQYNLKNYVFGR